MFHDVLGLGGGDYLPKFVRQYANLADLAVEALERFFADVQSGDFPGEAETYHMPEESAEILNTLSARRENGSHLLADEAMEN